MSGIIHCVYPQIRPEELPRLVRPPRSVLTTTVVRAAGTLADVSPQDLDLPGPRLAVVRAGEEVINYENIVRYF